CISCYRCVRFYKDYAGGDDLDVFGAHNHVYFGRYEDGPLENEFSGNLAEICPTGVFTDKTLKKHYTRKWDLTSAPSICNQCSLGCNTITAERYGTLRSVTSRYNGEVNGYFICDRGRFGYEYMNSDQRIRKPLIQNKTDQENRELNVLETLDELKKELVESEKVIGIGSPRASIESNFALQKYVGIENFYSGMSAKDHQLTALALDILKNSQAKTVSLREIEKADAVLILGEDLTNTAPMAALAVRQAVRNKAFKKAEKLQIPSWNDKAVREAAPNEKSPMYSATLSETKLDGVATKTFHTTPQEIANFGFAIAHELNSQSPKVKDLSTETLQLVKEAAKALKVAENPLVVTGTSCGVEDILKAAANVATSLCSNDKQTGLFITLPEANNFGVSLLNGKPLSELLQQETADKKESIVIIENDLYRRADAKLVDQLFENRKLIVLDHTHSKTTEKADFLLPAAPVAESTGSLINNEGRAQRFFQTFVPDHAIQASWRWMQAIADATSHKEMEPWEHLDDFLKAFENEYPIFRGITELTPPPDFNIAGQKIARESHRYSGRTAIHANKSVHEPQPAKDTESPLTYTMEGFHGEPPSSTIPYFWSPGWNSVQAINKYQIEVGGHLHGGDPGKRLLIADEIGKTSFYDASSQQKAAKGGSWNVIPLYQIFGSEELSSKSEAVSKRVPEPYLAISASEAEQNNLKPDSEVTLQIHGQSLRLSLKVKAQMPDRTIGLPVGLPGLPFIELPTTGKIKEVNNE
ncbi:MAG TPA: molybdopterin-dependent oxidoreductase, partial [Sunxiuqinia sp.]|nr:molybdopterin-dependent oxidoreductase [Sunxiuqinia sp.]